MDAARELADRFLRGDHDAALEALAALGADAAAPAAELVGRALRADAATHWNVFPRERTWAEHQLAVVQLAALPGVDEPALAGALVDACAMQRIDGKGSPLRPDVFAWMMRLVPDRVYAAAEVELPASTRFLRAALWTFPDARAREWMVGQFRTNAIGARFAYDDMRVGWKRSSWDAEEWSTRVHLLCDAGLQVPPFSVDPGLPPGTSAAQVRLACTYASSAADRLLRAVAANVRRYRSGDPARDAALVWWEVDELQSELLRVLLEAAGPPGARRPLVDAAEAAGRLGATTAAFLAADVPRPAWMDGDVPWEVDEVVDAGYVEVPDGRLSAADPYWAFEGVPFVLEVPPGRHPVRLTMAIHPLAGRACAVAELVIDEAAEVGAWERLGARDEEFGYRVEVGVGCFGAARALTEAPFHELAPPDFAAETAAYMPVDTEELGSIVMFTVAPQHQLCRTWAARSPAGDVTRVISDLGLLHVDPAAHPDEPLRAGPPPPEPDHEMVLSVPEQQAGVARGQRFRAAGGTVTVLEVTLPDIAWPGTLAVWFRWDATRTGDVLSAAEFRERFAPA